MPCNKTHIRGLFEKEREGGKKGTERGAERGAERWTETGTRGQEWWKRKRQGRKERGGKRWELGKAHLLKENEANVHKWCS